MLTYTHRVKPKPMRFRIDDTGDRLRITLTRDTNLLILLGPFWGGLFLYFSRDVWLPILHGDRDALVFGLIWVGIILFGVLTAMYGSLLTLFGTRELALSPTGLSFHSAVFGIGGTRQWRLAEISELTFVHPGGGRTRIPGGIAFMRNGKLVRVGDNLNEAEALRILRAMRTWAATHATGAHL